MALLALVRHGESTFNRDNRFTGHIDAPLTDLGRAEARAVALKFSAVRFDKAYTSTLRRASESLTILLSALGQSDVPTVSARELNERHYGELEGLNKAEMEKQFGEEQVHLWRRSYGLAPPGGESLRDTAERAIPYLKSVILPDVQGGLNVLVLAHGNSLRAIAMVLEGLTPVEVVKLNIATGEARVYELDGTLRVLSKRVV